MACFRLTVRLAAFKGTNAAKRTVTASPEVAFTPAEIVVLDRAAGDPPQAPKRTISHYLLVVAKLGGYLARTKDPPPGNMVVWRGLTRLADILLGAELHSQVVGN